MNFSSEVIINESINKVIEKLTDESSMGAWMQGFKSYQLLSGELFQENAKAAIVINMLGKEIEMQETILENKLPHSFISKYEAQGVSNVVKNVFTEQSEKEVLWLQESTFTFKSRAVRILSSFVVSLFKVFTKSMQKDFKAFVEEV